MKATVVILVVLNFNLAFAAVNHSQTRAQNQAQNRLLPLSFEPNRGQINPNVRFLSRTPDAAFFFSANELAIGLAKGPRDSTSFRVSFEGCTNLTVLKGTKPLPSKSNYVDVDRPARSITGIENYTDVKLSYRNQWAGINGAPVTLYVSAHGQIGKTDDRTTATSFQMSGENPRGKAYWQEYTAAAPHHGIGMVIMNDKTGYISRFSAYGTYAYHKGLTPRTSLSAGFLAGMSQISIDRSKIDWATLDPNDPAVAFNLAALRKIKPEFGVGLWLYSANYFGGISVLNIVPGKVKFSSNDTEGNYFKPELLTTAGYRFFLSDDITALPSVMVQLIKPFPVRFIPILLLKLECRAPV